MAGSFASQEVCVPKKNKRNRVQIDNVSKSTPSDTAADLTSPSMSFRELLQHAAIILPLFPAFAVVVNILKLTGSDQAAMATLTSTVDIQAAFLTAFARLLPQLALGMAV